MDAKSKLASYNSDQAKRVRDYTAKAGAKAPDKYAAGGAVKGKKGATNITIVIGKGDQAQPPQAAMAKPPMPPVVLPPPAPPMGAAPPPPGGPGIGGLGMPKIGGMKKGGRVTALPMTAGAATGEGREQKADSQAQAEGRKNKGDRI